MPEAAPEVKEGIPVDDSGPAPGEPIVSPLATVARELAAAESVDAYPQRVGPLVREACEARGGRIWVETEPGTGSVFRFTLPVAPSP